MSIPLERSKSAAALMGSPAVSSLAFVWSYGNEYLTSASQIVLVMKSSSSAIVKTPPLRSPYSAVIELRSARVHAA